MKKRTELQIMVDMLNFCKQPKSKTNVMYHSNLSWKQSKKYLSELTAKKLLQVHHSPIKYATTQKGMTFVQKYNNLIALLKKVEKTKHPS